MVINRRITLSEFKEKLENRMGCSSEMFKVSGGLIIIIIIVIIIVIMDLDSTMRKMPGPRGRDVLLRMQRAVISSTLNIARTFKVVT